MNQIKTKKLPVIFITVLAKFPGLFWFGKAKPSNDQLTESHKKPEDLSSLSNVFS